MSALVSIAVEELGLIDTPFRGTSANREDKFKKIPQARKISLNDLLEEIWELIPKELALRRKRGRTLEILSKCSKPPFASPRGPDDYRAYTLCDAEKGNAIMFVNFDV
jgi:hypothetical protein